MRMNDVIVIGSIAGAAGGLGCLGPRPADDWCWGACGERAEDPSRRSEYKDESSGGGANGGVIGGTSFGETVSRAVPPPPISGGTIAVTRDGDTVVVADPDRDQVQLVSVVGRPTLLATTKLAAATRPERVAVDDEQRVHVVLRGTGEVATFSLPTLEPVSRAPACREPRGIAWDRRLRRLHVACATGELVTMSADGTGAPEVRTIADDLRDVVVTANGIRVSTFRRAQVFDVTLTGATATVTELLAGRGGRHVGWRMIAAAPSSAPPSDEDVAIVGQRPGGVVPTAPEYYDVSGCEANGPVPVITHASGELAIPQAVLPVDIAFADGHAYVVAAGNAHTRGASTVIVPRWRAAGVACSLASGVKIPGQPTSVAVLRGGSRVAVFTREPAALHVVEGLDVTASVVLSDESREDTGHAIFHANSGAGLACASCHPDGRDDGHAWRSSDIGPRRTPSLLGTLAGTAPYHWDGSARDLRAVAALSFVARMKGPKLDGGQSDALASWLEKLPRMTTRSNVDAAAAARGRALFEGAAGCASCHTGALGTDNRSVDVGTGLVAQVPSLVGVAERAPYLHDGSVRTLAAVLDVHGAGGLGQADRLDLAAFLQTF
jgi:hypothetical protein